MQLKTTNPKEIKFTENSSVVLYKRMIPEAHSKQLFSHYLSSLIWKHDEYTFSGKKVLSPRLISLMGSKAYRYSGVSHEAYPFDVETLYLIELFDIELDLYGYNGCLFNHYRNGNDSIGMHTDNEPDLDLSSPIISLSLGESREFVVQHDKRKETILLEDGDVVVMNGMFQQECKHGIPKQPQYTGERISLTFRKFY